MLPISLCEKSYQNIFTVRRKYCCAKWKCISYLCLYYVKLAFNGMDLSFGKIRLGLITMEKFRSPELSYVDIILNFRLNK